LPTISQLHYVVTRNQEHSPKSKRRHVGHPNDVA
jgi:hypothetical protein